MQTIPVTPSPSRCKVHWWKLICDALEFGRTETYHGNPKSFAECMAHMEDVFEIEPNSAERSRITRMAKDWFNGRRERD